MSECIHHFREDWLLWRTFSIGKWRVFIISEKIGHSGERFWSGNGEYSSFQRRLVTLENVFDGEMKSIHHFREDWLLWRTFSIKKWRVNVFINSEKIGWSLWRTFLTGKWRVFIISEKIGYSGERFWSGNEWMYSSFQRRLVTLENVFDREIKSERIHHFREDWLCRTFSFGKWWVNAFRHTMWLAKDLNFR